MSTNNYSNMSQCFGDGKCIHRKGHGYYNGYSKLYRCSYNCKLVKCFKCCEQSDPLWVLEINAGLCEKCLIKRRGNRIMDKIFK